MTEDPKPQPMDDYCKHELTETTVNGNENMTQILIECLDCGAILRDTRVDAATDFIDLI